ncbi:reverse transcriptase domain-containing protein [Tanacetum coccineum]
MAPSRQSSSNNSSNNRCRPQRETPGHCAIIAQQLQTILPQIVTQVTNNVNNANNGNGNGGNNGSRGRVAAMAMSWNDFKALMVEEFCPSNEMEKLENEFWNHKIVGANHASYTNRFHELAKLVPHLVTPESSRIKRYIAGLAPEIRGMLRVTQPTTIQTAILRAGILTDEAISYGTLIKGSDKRKGVEESSKTGGSSKDNKKANTGTRFVATVPTRNEFIGSNPKRNKQEELFTYKEEMAPMALSDTKVNNDKSCSKTYLTNYETLKKQYDDLIVKLHEIEFKAATYKRGLATVEDQLVTYRKREEKEGIDFKIEKFENASKDLDKLLGSQITNNSKKGLGYYEVPPPHPLIYNAPVKLDLSYFGLDEFKEPEFKGYGPENSKQESNVVCDKESENYKKISDESLAEEHVEFTKPENHGKPVKKSVRYAEMYRSQSPRGNQRNWNGQKSNHLGSDFVMNNKACFVCESFDHLKKDCSKRIIKPVWNNTRRVNHHYATRITHSNPRRNMILQVVLMRSGIRAINTARPRAGVDAAKPKAAHNTVKRNRFHNIKASMQTQGRHEHEQEVDTKVTTASAEVSTGSPKVKTAGDSIDDIAAKTLVYIRRSAAKTKDKEERQRISRAKGLKTAGYKVTTDSRLLLLVRKLMLLKEVTTAKSS